MATILKNNIKPGGSTLKGLVATDASGNQRDVKFVRQVDVNGVATTVYDTFDHYEYSEITITANHTYNGDVGADGSGVSVASAPTYKQTRWSVGASGERYEETTLTTGAAITYSGTHVSADGTVSGDSLGTTVMARNESFASSVATITMNDKSASTSGVSVAQAANAVTGTANYNGKTQACYKAVTEYQIINFASVGDIPAKGGSSYGRGTGQSRTAYTGSSYTKYEIHNVYTSGSHAHNGSYTTASGWTDGSTPSAGAWGGNTTVTGSTVSGSNLTTTSASRTSRGNSSVTWNGKTASAAIYQAANTYSDAWNNPSISAFTYNSTSFAYGGGTATVSSKTASQSGTRTWTSGSTQSISNSSFTWSFSGSATGFSVNTSTGAVTVASNAGSSARSITVTAKAVGAGSKSATKTATVSQAANPSNGYAYADLGLPSGLKWAKCNVGAASETANGNYYIWGLNVVCPTSNAGYYSPSNGDLPLSRDIANLNWKSSWRMPTLTECTELINNTTITNSSISVHYTKFTSKKSSANYIVLPLAGSCQYGNSSSITGINSYGIYWTKSASPYNSTYTMHIQAGDTPKGGSQNPGHGLTVRPVIAM